MSRILEEVASKVERAYRPEGHPHPVGNYVSASQIVKKTAEELAEAMIAKREGKGDNVDPYWTYKGDALGDRAFEHIPYQEARSTTPIPGHEEWVIAGHCDGVDIENDGVVVLEHKAHINATGDKVEHAKRQALLYLGMMWDTVQRKGTPHTFEQAQWAQEHPNFTWQQGWEPEGVIVAVARPFPPPIVQREPVDVKEVEDVLNFYREKAEIVVRAVKERDKTIAHEEWDIHIDEFDFIEEVDPADKQTIEALFNELDEIKEKIDELEDQKSRIKSQIRNIHEKNGLETIEAGNYRSRVVESTGRRTAKVKELEEAGLDEFIREGSSYSYLRVDQVAED